MVKTKTLLCILNCGIDILTKTIFTSEQVLAFLAIQFFINYYYDYDFCFVIVRIQLCTNQSIVPHLLLRKRRSQSMISLLLFLAFVNKCEHEEPFFYDKGFFSCILSIEIIISLSRMMLSFCSFSILILYVFVSHKVYSPGFFVG